MTDQILAHNPDKDPVEHDIPEDGAELSDKEIVNILQGYLIEAEDARESARGNRDDVWESNIDLYWNRFDFSQKQNWQSDQVLPEAPQFVNRFAAAMRQGLVRDGEFMTVNHPGDPNGNLSNTIKKAMKFWLDNCGRNATGQPIEFANVFEDVMKLAAMMGACASVTWKERDGRGYVAVDPIDPREFWLDPTGRGLYRIKTTFMDLHEVEALANLKNSKGESIYNIKAIDQLQSFSPTENSDDKAELTGHDNEETSTREPIRVDEYLCDLIDTDGKVRFENYLFVVANEQWLIRGPEKNPWWHKNDWIVFASAISVPLSVYGKTYMEDWAKLARTFNELTNLIIDAVHANSMNAFIGNPSALEDPAQLEEGIHPNKIFYMEEDADIRQVLQALELGTLPAEAITLWQALKKELQEGAMFSEIALGQLSSGEKTATEITESQQGSASTLQSIARNIETAWLEPILNLVWKTGLQHLKKDDAGMKLALGEENFNMLFARRKEFVQSQITFKVDAISGLIERNEKFRKIMSLLQIVSSNELLLKAFMQNADINVLVRKIFQLNGIDMTELQPNQQQGEVQGVVDSSQRQQEAAQQLQSDATPLPTGDEIAANISQIIPPQESNNGN